MERDERLRTERNCWLATTGSDGRPHLTPIWFVWHAERVWICTTPTAVKAANVASQPEVMVALESGNDPVVLRGSATVHILGDGRPTPEGVAEAFATKYAWDLAADADYSTLIEILPTRWLVVSTG